MRAFIHGVKIFWYGLTAGIIFTLLWGVPPLGAAGGSADVVVHMSSQGAISFEADQSSLQFDLADYQAGAVSADVAVVYSIMANDVGRLEGVVQVRLVNEFDGIALETKMSGYAKHGGNASLVPAQGDYVALTTTDLGVADKIIDEGTGRLVDGNLTLLYRARVLQDLTAGQQDSTIIVSFVDN